MKRLMNSMGWILVAGSLPACKTVQTVKVEQSRGELVLYSTDDSSSAMASPAVSDSVADAKESLIEEAKKSPDQIAPLVNLAHVQVARGELDEAEATVRKILKKDLKSEAAKLVLGDIYYRRGMYDMAGTILEGLGGAKSKDSQVLNLVGLVALAKGENAIAMEALLNAVRANSSDVAARMNLGVLYLKYHQLQEAAVQFERVLAVLPQHEDAKLHMAAILTSRGQFEAAKEMYKDILNTSKRNPVALYNFALLQTEQKEYEDAMDTLKTYLSAAEGKSTHTDRAFALISEIKSKMSADGKEISDEDIVRLAQDLDQRDRTTKSSKRTAKADVEQKPAVQRNEAPAQQPSEVKTGMAAKAGPTMGGKPDGDQGGKSNVKQTEKSRKQKSEDIDDLEKVLMN